MACETPLSSAVKAGDIRRLGWLLVVRSIALSFAQGDIGQQQVPERRPFVSDSVFQNRFDLEDQPLHRVLQPKSATREPNVRYSTFCIFSEWVCHPLVRGLTEPL